MPIEKKPVNPLPKNYIPHGGMPYKVKTNDDWGSVAKAHGISVQDLIRFNFNTLSTSEINWYLRENVGCNAPTRDGKNWMFTSNASPGVIYIPPKKDWKRPSFPPTEVVPDPIVPLEPERSGIWFGFGGQTGGHLAIGGKDTVEACLYSLESYQDRFWMNIDGYRVGPGLGGSIGAVFVLVSHLYDPWKLNNFKVSGWDFQANIVGKWGDLAKQVKTYGAVQKYAKLGNVVDKSMTVLEYNKTREAINSAYKVGTTAYGALKESATPDVGVIPIPMAGVGAEVSVFYGWGTIIVHGVTMDGKSQ